MWMLNAGANFIPYAVVPAVLLVVAVGLFRRHHWTALALVPLAAWAVLMLSSRDLLAASRAGACTSDEAGLRVMTANVLMSNDRLDDLARDVLAAAPDAVVFEELRHDLEAVSPALAAAYPYRISTEVPWVTLASRWPLQDARRLTMQDDDDRARDPLVATIVVDGRPVTLFAVHVMPPLNAIANALHVSQYRLLAEQVRRHASGPLLVVGDFNANSFSPTFAGFLRGSGLRIASLQGDEEPTHFPRRFLGLRIDHILERGFHVCGEQVINLTGSDHRGVLVDLRLPADGAPGAVSR